MKNNEKIFFPGLNSLRAIAALTVVIYHFNQFLPIIYGIPEAFKSNEMAHLSVTLFFVLSGYLITYLLLLEKEKYGRINIINFYKRRALRIWPLYYLTVILSALFFPFYKYLPDNPKTSTELLTAFTLIVCMLPNIATNIGLKITTLRPLWSIGVEEQFYLIWPWFVNKYENIFKVGFWLICSNLVLRGVFKILNLDSFFNFISIFPIHLMIVGCMGAYLIKTKHRYINVLFNRYIELFCCIIWLSSYLYPLPIPYLQSEFYTIIFLVIIINISTNPNSLAIILDNKILDYIGRFSYGIYVLHMPVFILFSFCPMPNFIKNNTYYNWILIATTLSVLVIVALFSYLYFEKPFLKRKEKYMLIESTAQRT